MVFLSAKIPPNWESTYAGQVHPEYLRIYALDDMNQMVMVAPIDTHEHEAKKVAAKCREKRTNRLPIGGGWDLDLQYHDRNDDGKHTITESFETRFVHSGILQARRENLLRSGFVQLGPSAIGTHQIHPYNCSLQRQ